MERDFLGLKWKPSNENVKKNTREMDADPGYNDLSNNYLSPSSQFRPFSSVQEDLQRKDVQNNLNMTRKTFPFLDERNSWHNINHLSNTCIASAGGYTVAAPIYNNHSVGGSTSSIDQQSPISSTGKDKLSMGSSSLTIFYDNAVYAYDDILPEKAEDIIRMAKSTREASKLVASDISSNQAQHSPGQSGSSLQSTAATYIQTVPQARKRSLYRFMEKRKERYH